MSFDKYVYPCNNQHPNPELEHFSHLKEFPLVISNEPYFTREESTLLIFSHHRLVLPICIIHINGIKLQYALWRGAGWLLAVSKIFLIYIHVVMRVNLFVFIAVSLYEYTPIVLSIPMLAHIWFVSRFWLSLIKLL